MGYMVAKYMAKPGSIALKQVKENAISDASYLRRLGSEYLNTGIEILTIGNFDVHAEYEPVTFVKDRDDFERKIRGMYLKNHNKLGEW